MFTILSVVNIFSVILDQEPAPSIVYPQHVQSITSPLRRLLEKAEENVKDFTKYLTVSYTERIKIQGQGIEGLVWITTDWLIWLICFRY